MPKIKNHKGLTKRVKITATGKVKYKRCCGGHLMSSKNAKRRRRISGTSTVACATANTIKVRIGN